MIIHVQYGFNRDGSFCVYIGSYDILYPAVAAILIESAL